MSASSTEKLIKMIEAGDSTGILEMLDKDPSLADARTGHGVSLLVFSLYYRHSEIADLIRARKQTPLDVFEASAVGDSRRTLELLRLHPEIINTSSPDGFSPLHLAAFFDQPLSANILLANGADCDLETDNAQKIRPIHSAAASRSSRMVRILLSAGADPDAQQQGGFTALHSAAKHGNSAMLKALLAHGARLDVKTDDDKVAIDFATDAGHLESADLLK